MSVQASLRTMAAAGLREGLDHDLVDVHVERAREGEEQQSATS